MTKLVGLPQQMLLWITPTWNSSTGQTNYMTLKINSDNTESSTRTGVVTLKTRCIK